MKKFLYISIIFTLLLNLLSVSSVFSYTLSDANDIFTVNAPSPNQILIGNVNVSIRAYDDEQGAIPFTAQLFDRNTCENTFYGSITSQTTLTSHTANDSVITWNTRSTSTNSNLSDGEYCLRVCVSLVDGGTPYSACSSRAIILANNNRAPNITSTPQGTTIFENGTWSYQVQANDPDNNPLTYRLNVAPTFLSINNSTGLIQTNSNSKALAAGINRADYQVILSVDDGLGGTATQQFTFSIVRQTVTTTPPPSNNNTGTNTPNNNTDSGSTTNQSSTIVIEFPKENSVLKGENNLIKWQINDPDGIEEIILNYSSDALTWTELAKFDGSTSEFNWDVSEINDGAYYLQFVVKDSKNSSISKRSDRFSILNNSDTDNVSKPLIVNVKPEKDTSVSGVDTISGDFVPSEGAEIKPESFKISVDGEDFIDKCEVTKTGFLCNLGDNRISQAGKHTIKVEIEDSSSQKATEEWVFDIFEQPNGDEGSIQNEKLVLFGREIARNTLFLLVLICCLSALLLTIPWIIYSMWKREDHDEYYKDDADPNITTTVYNPTPVDSGNSGLYNPVTPSVTANYYVPDYTSMYGTTTPAATDYSTQTQPVYPEVNVNTYNAPTPTATASTAPATTVEPTTTTFTYDPNVPLNIPNIPATNTANPPQNGSGYYEPTPTS